ncbi:MAG: hypothetical protein AAGE52_23690 [Myxococcota bacterium]
MRIWGLAVALGVGMSSFVHADIAPPRPEDLDCPRGSKGRVSEGGGAWCEPTVCANDVTCGEGYRCSTADIGLCVEEIQVPTERVRPTLDNPAPPSATKTVRSVRRRGCEPDNTCLNVDSTCERALRCVKVEEAVDAPSAPIRNVADPNPANTREDVRENAVEESGCSCQTTTPVAGAWWVLLWIASRRRGPTR